MSENLTPEDRLLWARRAPRASYWLGVSNTHPNIHGHYQPTPTGPPTGPPTAGPPNGPPPPYAPPHPPYHPHPPGFPAPGLATGGGQPPFYHPHPALPVPGLVTHGGQVMFHHPGPAIGNGFQQVPLYDVRSQTQAAQPLPNRGVSVTRFTVSVPIKPLRNRDTPARDEIAFEWDTPLGDFYDRVCARMDVDPRTARIGYKFEVDPKRSIREIPPGNTTGYNAMLDKVKDRIARARTRQVILEIHNLEAKRLGRKKKQNVPAPDSMTVRQTRELGILKRKLSCVDSNHRPWCWVASDGSHRSLTIFQVTLWAQLIAEGTATYDCPPTCRAFNSVPKRVYPAKKVPPVPSIHLHLPAQLNVGSSTAGPSDTGAAQPKVIEVIGSDSEWEVVDAPVTKLKAEVEGSDWKF